MRLPNKFISVIEKSYCKRPLSSLLVAFKPGALHPVPSTVFVALLHLDRESARASEALTGWSMEKTGSKSQGTCFGWSRSHLKIVFSSHLGVGSSLPALEIRKYSCGCKLGSSLALNENPNFEKVSIISIKWSYFNGKSLDWTFPATSGGECSAWLQCCAAR